MHKKTEKEIEKVKMTFGDRFFTKKDFENENFNIKLQTLLNHNVITTTAIIEKWELSNPTENMCELVKSLNKNDNLNCVGQVSKHYYLEDNKLILRIIKNGYKVV